MKDIALRAKNVQKPEENDRFLTILGLSWGRLGPSWGVLGPSWGRLGPSWGYLGSSWGRLGAVLGPSWR